MSEQIKEEKKTKLEKITITFTDWVGTPNSIFFHTLFFIGIFSLHFLDYSIDSILLILTTLVSLEAIYLAIFIQMTVNRNTKSLAAVEADIDEIQEDVEDIEEEVEEINEELGEIQEDVEVDELLDKKTIRTLTKLESQLQTLMDDINQLKKRPIN